MTVFKSDGDQDDRDPREPIGPETDGTPMLDNWREGEESGVGRRGRR